MIFSAKPNRMSKDFMKFGCGKTGRELLTGRSIGLQSLYDDTNATGTICICFFKVSVADIQDLMPNHQQSQYRQVVNES